MDDGGLIINRRLNWSDNNKELKMDSKIDKLIAKVDTLIQDLTARIEALEGATKSRLDWSRIPVDTLVHDGIGTCYHFAGLLEDGRKTVFHQGATSKTKNNSVFPMDDMRVSDNPTFTRAEGNGYAIGGISDGLTLDVIDLSGNGSSITTGAEGHGIKDALAYRITGVADGWEE